MHAPMLKRCLDYLKTPLANLIRSSDSDAQLWKDTFDFVFESIRFGDVVKDALEGFLNISLGKSNAF